MPFQCRNGPGADTSKMVYQPPGHFVPKQNDYFGNGMS